ncbi:MAG: hypothetical protein Q9224_002465, partial [Gallowayella concinna]
MLRRISSRFTGKKKDESQNKILTNGATNGRVNGDQKRTEHTVQQPDAPDYSVTQDDVQSNFQKFAHLLHASNRPLPSQFGDGASLEEGQPSGFLKDLKTFGYKDYNTMLQVMKGKATGELQEYVFICYHEMRRIMKIAELTYKLLFSDKTYTMEHLMQLVAGLPSNSKFRVDLTNSLIDELWNSLQHPPMSYLGDKYTYRQPDGSHNNVMYPHLGAANTPYARSITANVFSPGAMPDPGLVFDSVMVRHEFREHPNKVSSVFFYWASLIIHDLFQTDHRDFSNSQTSSYLDLSILYGDTEEDQNAIRTFKDGKLKPDCFSESRLLGFPPGCGVLLIMLNRFHNYVVEQLAIINENERFSKPRDGLPDDMKAKALGKRDHDLFNTGRLVTCGLYINITLFDYLRTIVNLNRSNTTWTLDPRAKMGNGYSSSGTPSGVGNAVSAEFNLAYRWHSCISEKDDLWTQNLYKEIFGKPADEVSFPELLQGLGKWEHGLDPDPQKRPFAKLQRGPDGKFPDEGLARILTESIEDVSGAFGANNIPKCMRAISMLGLQQGRKWNLGSFNEFRKFFGLKPHATFEDINSDPTVADSLRHLYEHPDHVEIYTGLVSEEAKVPMVPGVGIAPTFTISRAVLSDAVALVRGDRFYTIDYNTKSLTNWGYSEVQYNLNIEQGCMISKLILRALPDYFKPDSIYCHYPMTVPSENRKIMRDLGRELDYSWDRPAFISPRVDLTSYVGAKYLLERDQEFNVTWGEALGFLMGKGGLDFMLSGDSKFHSQQNKTMAKAFYRENWHQHIKEFYEETTLKLLHQNSFKLAGMNMVDITRDVGNIAHVHFAANMFSLPLKTEETPGGVFSEQELYMVISVIFMAIFSDTDPTKSFPLRHAARAVSQQLGKLIEAKVHSVSMTGMVAGVVDRFRENHNPLSEYGVHMIRRLLESGLGVSEITWSQILPTAVAMVPNQAQAVNKFFSYLIHLRAGFQNKNKNSIDMLMRETMQFTQLLDYYLSDEGKHHLPTINKYAKMDTPEAEDKLLHYAMEGIRLNGTFGTSRQSTVHATIDDGDHQVRVKPGDKIFCSF